MKDITDLKELLNSQKLAVLATQSDDGPHESLVAFSCSDDARRLFLMTHRQTRKYRDIIGNPRIAMLIDNRSNRDSDFEQATAITAKGVAKELNGDARDKWLATYLKKHPQLTDFARLPEVALIKIEVTDYQIAGFDTTHHIKP